MYDVGKVIFIGGGNQGANDLPSAQAEVIDLTAPAPAWRQTLHPMNSARRQHNATILADGTVLVTGGTKGPGFNDLSSKNTVHAAELWNPDPASETWTLMASESVDRCYHSTATLFFPSGELHLAGHGKLDLGLLLPVRRTASCRAW